MCSVSKSKDVFVLSDFSVPHCQDSSAHSGASESGARSSGCALQGCNKSSSSCSVSQVQDPQNKQFSVWDWQMVVKTFSVINQEVFNLPSMLIKLSPLHCASLFPHSEDSSTSLNACRIHGHLYVNKVAGNFHITVGKYVSKQLLTCSLSYIDIPVYIRHFSSVQSIRIRSACVLSVCCVALNSKIL